jgi:hypothetical protein
MARGVSLHVGISEVDLAQKPDYSQVGGSSPTSRSTILITIG